MKLHEFVGKSILRTYGIPVPKSFFVREGETVEKKILPCVLKSQVLVGSRMKNGGVLFANTDKEFDLHLRTLLERKIRGETPYGVLVEEKISVKHEHYISLVLDRDEKDLVLIYSCDGGVNVESSRNFIKAKFDDVLNEIDPNMANIATTLKRIALEKDVTLLEINPLGESESGEFVALDAVFHLDDSALYRQPWAKKFLKKNPHSFHYLKLDGDIGVIGCGAGIVMATMDTVEHFGGKPADFLDLGGGASEATTLAALKTLKNDGIRKIVMNIFGGITKCDETAKAIVNFKRENPDYDLYVRITGTNEEEAKRILKENHISFYDDMYSVIKDAVVGDVR